MCRIKIESAVLKPMKQYRPGIDTETKTTRKKNDGNRALTVKCIGIFLGKSSSMTKIPIQSDLNQFNISLILVPVRVYRAIRLLNL